MSSLFFNIKIKSQKKLEIKTKLHDADYIFITHDHYDHYDLASINNIIKESNIKPSTVYNVISPEILVNSFELIHIRDNGDLRWH